MEALKKVKMVNTLRFSLDDSVCDHHSCEAEADRFFVYQFSDGDVMVGFACPDHPEPLGKCMEPVGDEGTLH